MQYVNHPVALYKWADQPVWGATGVDEDLEVLEPLWSCGHVLPTSLADLLDDGDREADDQVGHEEHDANLVSMKVMSDE